MPSDGIQVQEPHSGVQKQIVPAILSKHKNRDVSSKEYSILLISLLTVGFFWDLAEVILNRVAFLTYSGLSKVEEEL